MFLNELVDDSNVLVALLKFSEKEHLESLKNGNLYLNNFKYYKELESEEGKKGQGDSKDLTLIINDLDFSFSDSETKEVVFKGRAKQSFLESKEDYMRHVFCCTGITPDLLEVLELKGEVAKVKLVLPDELRIKALEDFGGYVAFINSGNFMKKINETCAEKGITYFSNKVSYLDMNQNHINRIQAFNNNELSFYFEKDLFFKYQHEYRIVFPDIISDDPETVNVGDIEDEISIISMEEFLNGELVFTINLYQKED